MNSRQRSSQKYFLKKGFIRPPEIKKEVKYKRTEGNTRFEYDNSIANAFAGWSSMQRDNGLEPLFSLFYDQLTEDYQKHITVSEVGNLSENNEPLANHAAN